MLYKLRLAWMPTTIMPSLLLLALLASAPGQPCAYDAEKMMSLSLRDFDQDLNGGWRSLAHTPGCQKAAASLIRRYRKEHGPASILYWHEGQLRAQVGQTGRAVRLFDLSRKPAASDPNGWNHYVDATIAFLKRDRPALLKARSRLAALPKPKDFSPTATGPSGIRITLTWPPNLNVVDGLIACFGKSYEEAYGRPCVKPIAIVS